MACATLKRSLDWESLNQRPTKRRRCSPYTTASGTAQSSNAQATSTKVTCEPVPSVFAEASLTKLTPGTSSCRHSNYAIKPLSLTIFVVTFEPKKKLLNTFPY